MKFIRSFLALAILLIFQSCNTAPELSFIEHNISTKNNTIVEINVPMASGEHEVALNINKVIGDKLIAALSQYDPEDKTSVTVEEKIEQFNSEFTRFKNEFPDSPQIWEAQIDGEVAYKSSELISIALTTYMNTGGAHGITVINFINFDAVTGKEITKEALFNDIDGFREIAKNAFNEKIKDRKDFYFNSNQFSLPENIGFSEDKLVLLYNTYEIAPYSTGITEVHIPLSNVSSFLNYY
ncbi:DUF3298 and DUF4163 domain-containing protein [Mangrovimonas aestuarii]|uniref:DUF3298 and DUF4163 domain-containing protein n=1 Tax=Mangrovimonas aestuarii TaxID=3018443 RepID=UPI002379004F|nr:DUF3298 and DUF4163 domain-containing protein [Mangrovimonas aestuarii]